MAFLEDTPGAEAVARLDPERSPPDVFAVRGRNVYLHYPNGTARSKLTNEYLARQLQTASTMRNWRTVLALLEMVDTLVAGVHHSARVLLQCSTDRQSASRMSSTVRRGRA